jgi:uncharacterized membrane protein YqiK
MYRESSTSGIADVMKKGSGTQVIVGIIILIIGVGFGLSLKSVLITYLAVAAVAAGFAIIISSFLIIIKQYDRAIILRLGKYQKRVGQGVRIRVPFADSVLVVDIREKVREFKAERMLTRDNVPVTIDAILRYRVIEDCSTSITVCLSGLGQHHPIASKSKIVQQCFLFSWFFLFHSN